MPKVFYVALERGKGKKEGNTSFFGCMVRCIEQLHMLTNWQKLGTAKYM